MFKFFKKKKDKPSTLDGVFQRIGAAIERKQRKSAAYLNGKTKDWGGGQILIALFFLTVLLGGGAVLVVWHSFQQPAPTIQIRPIRLPKQILYPPAGEQTDTLTKDITINLLAFRYQLDSLQQTAHGKRLYDSIAQYRSGLLDSLVFIEKVYQQQLKTREDERKK